MSKFWATKKLRKGSRVGVILYPTPTYDRTVWQWTIKGRVISTYHEEKNVDQPIEIVGLREKHRTVMELSF